MSIFFKYSNPSSFVTILPNMYLNKCSVVYFTVCIIHVCSALCFYQHGDNSFGINYGIYFFKLGRNTRKILFSQWHKLLRNSPTGVKPMTFRTPVGRSTTELQETHGSFLFNTFWWKSYMKIMKVCQSWQANLQSQRYFCLALLVSPY